MLENSKIMETWIVFVLKITYSSVYLVSDEISYVVVIKNIDACATHRKAINLFCKLQTALNYDLFSRNRFPERWINFVSSDFLKI